MAKFVNSDHTAIILEVDGAKKLINPDRQPEMWAEWVDQAIPYVDTEEYQAQQADTERLHIEQKAEFAKDKLKELIQQEAKRINKEGIEIDAATRQTLIGLKSKYADTLELGFFKNAKEDFEKEVFPSELSQLKTDILQMFTELADDNE